MAKSSDAAGLSSKLEPLGYLMYRSEANPRTRSGGLGVLLLDTTPDWERFRGHFDNASRRVLRLRQKVVVPTLPTAAPQWVVDPDFNLDFHVRRVRVPEPATLREVFDLAEVLVQSPMDIARPLWTATLVEGLAEGRAAMLLQTSHALTDGVGAVEMFAQLYDLQRDPPAESPAAPPTAQHLSPNDLMRQGFKQLPGGIVGAVWKVLWGALSMVGRVLLNPRSALAGASGYARSGARAMSLAAEPSPLLRQRNLASRTEALVLRLSDLHQAAKACGGSINDAYLAGLCGALGRYHQGLGVPIDTLPMAVPVNIRTEADPTGGNRFTNVYVAATVGTADPVARMKMIRAQMTQRREERARDNIGFVQPLLSVLPGVLPAPVLDAISGGAAPWDVTASNLPFFQGDTYIAGAKVLQQFSLGPLPGVAMTAVLTSRGGWCTITVRYDRAAVEDDQLFARCLLEGFDEILALAGDPAPRAAPASSPSTELGDEL